MIPRTMNVKYLRRMNECFEYRRVHFSRDSATREIERREEEIKERERERERPI